MDDYIANSETESYRKVVDEVHEIGQAAKERTIEDKHEYIDYLCDKFAKNTLSMLIRGLALRCNVPQCWYADLRIFLPEKGEAEHCKR